MTCLRYTGWIGCLGLCAVLSVTSRAQESQTTVSALAEKYTIIFERNIFSRDRQPDQPAEADTPPPAPPAPPIEANYILRGISKELARIVAFIEQVDRGLIEKYELGSRIARGRITALTLDSLTYEFHSEPNEIEAMGDPNTVNTTQVNIGQTLLGQEGGSGVWFSGNGRGSDGRSRRGRTREDRQSRNNVPSSETESRPSLDGADPSEILRQLMERRQRELDN